MPVDLRPALGKQVFIQMKTQTYIIGKQQGQLMPAMMNDEKNNPIPVAVDYLLGTLTEVDSTIVLRYQLPDGTKMQVLINEDLVNCVFFEDDRKIEVIADVPSQGSIGA